MFYSFLVKDLGCVTLSVKAEFSKIHPEILIVKIPEKSIIDDLGWLGELDIEQKITTYFIRHYKELPDKSHRIPSDFRSAELVGLEVKANKDKIDAVFRANNKYYVVETKHKESISRGKKQVTINAESFENIVKTKCSDYEHIRIIRVVLKIWKASDRVIAAWQGYQTK